MGDSQGNNKGKEKENYEAWTKEDSDELLQLIIFVVRGKTTSGHTSMSLDSHDTNATTFGGMENFSYDLNNDIFITPDHYEPPYQPPSPHPSISPPQLPLSLEVPTEKPINRMRSRPEYKVSSNSVGNNSQAKVLENLSVGIEIIAANFEKITNFLDKRERYQEAKGNIWSAIKEIPNLDDRTHYMAANLLNTNAKKDFFLMLSIEERSDWIK
uniref:Uncharacterized protein At2g29880 family n=1 Tax=Cajanus cajan TaxID=3821 RepID=A0A151UI26_CAJCA